MKNIFKILKFLSFPLIVYALWEIYWASKVGSLFIKWHTHLALYVFAWLFFYILFRFLNKKIHFKNYANIQLLLAVFWGILFFIELFLIFFGIGDTYMERIKYGYVSRYGSNHEEYYRNHKPNEVFYISRPEFNYIRKCNAEGFSDIEWSIEKRKGEKRILALGDSFTEGVGAPFDSSYVSILRGLFAISDSSITLMNAANAGDDPFVNFVCYRDLLTKYKPDFIIQFLSANDMNTDLATKGGLERFQKKGKLKFRDAPWWEPIYALSYVSRLFFNSVGYNELLIKTPFSENEKRNLDQKMTELLQVYSKLAKKNETLLLLVLQPDQKSIYTHEFEYDLSNIVNTAQKTENIKVINLLPFYVNYFAGKEDSIKTCYWINDGHHNSKGYEVMAKAVKYNLDSLGILYKTNIVSQSKK